MTTYSRPCVDCGKPTDASGGFKEQRERCNDCNLRHQHETRQWTRETCIAALQRWAEKHGRAPTAGEWQASGPDHPCEQTVHRECGGWSDALEAAGLPVRWRSRTTNVTNDELVARHAAGESVEKLAEDAGCTASNIRQRLERQGVELPRRDMELARERRETVIEGYRNGESAAALAARLGIPATTVHAIAWRARKAGETLRDQRRAA